MRKKYLTVVLLLVLFCGFKARSEENRQQIRIFDEVVFYDGYRMADNPDKDLDDGILRHSCSLYSTKLSESVLNSLGEQLDVNVTVEPCCDNYDRIGNINLALVPKGLDTYVPDETQRIEIGRFITPFMDKNRFPKEVPYSFEISYLSRLLRDKSIREQYDLWLELELFGIPYAANQQIAGCEGRSDVFAATLDFSTSAPAGPSEGNILVPIVIKKPEYVAGGNLNNYSETATDEIGKTVKTYSFDVTEDLLSSQIVLITSNHGANANGEEYNRRWHFVYLDDELVLSYRPGRDSCEPFRKYNTQSNGIYGMSKKSDAMWQSFSNWCPGDVIDNRIIDTENIEKGTHKIRIEVPDALFADQQGDIPVSMYFVGSSKEVINGVEMIKEDLECPVKVIASDGVLSFTSSEDIESLEVFSIDGRKIAGQDNLEPIRIGTGSGVYIVGVGMADGIVYSFKVRL